MSLAERRWLRLFTLSILFFAQGIPWGFMAITLPAHLAKLGLDDAARGGLLAMTTWPFVFKWAFGPAMDAFTIRRFGRWRPWIIFAQAMMAVTLALLLALPDLAADHELLGWLILLHTCFNAMQNVATDALAIDLLEPAERGRANGIMYAAKYAGGAVGGAGMAVVIAHAGMREAIAIQVAMLAAITLVPLLVRERAELPPPRPPLGEVVRAIGRAFRLRATQLAAVVTLVMLLATGMLSVIAPSVFVQHLHWDPDHYAEVAGGPGLVVGFLGSIAAGLLADLIGHRRLAALASLTMATGWIAFALGEAWWMDDRFVAGLFVIEPLAQSVMIVAVWSLCMASTARRVAATQFAIYTSFINLSSTIGARVLAPFAGEHWDYRTAYLVGAGLQLAVIAVLPFIDTRRRADEVDA